MYAVCYSIPAGLKSSLVLLFVVFFFIAFPLGATLALGYHPGPWALSWYLGATFVFVCYVCPCVLLLSLGATFVFVWYVLSLGATLLLPLGSTFVFACYVCLPVLLVSLCVIFVLCVPLLSLCATFVVWCYVCLCVLLLCLGATFAFGCWPPRLVKVVPFSINNSAWNSRRISNTFLSFGFWEQSGEARHAIRSSRLDPNACWHFY